MSSLRNVRKVVALQKKFASVTVFGCKMDERMDTGDFQSTASTSEKKPTTNEEMTNLFASLSISRAHKGDKMAALARKRKRKSEAFSGTKKARREAEKNGQNSETTNHKSWFEKTS